MSTSRSKVMIGFITVLHLTDVVPRCGESSLSVDYDRPYSGFRITGGMNVCYSVKDKITFIQAVPNLAKTHRISDVYFLSFALKLPVKCH